MARPQPRLIAGVTTIWLFLAVVLFLYWNDIDAVPDDWSTILGGGKGVYSSSASSSSLNGTWVDGVKIPGLDGKITGEEKKEYARNLIRLNETLRERFPYHPRWFAARATTLQKIETLALCLEQDTCTDTQGDIVLVGSLHFGNSLSGGVSGEDIWARSSMDAFEELGRTVLIAYRILEVLDIYQAIPKLITLVITDASEIDLCVNFRRPVRLEKSRFEKGEARRLTSEEMTRWDIRSETEGGNNDGWGIATIEGDKEAERGGCIRREEYPEGIPIWKMFSFHFWGTPAHILGRNWTVSPEDYRKHPCQNGSPGNFFLGYSVEKYCKRFVDAPEQRLRRAYILAKYISILDSDTFAWDSPNKTLFAEIAERHGMSFVAGADHEKDKTIQAGIHNMGRMPEDRFYEELAMGRLVVGVGAPVVSPTPYDALCLGVPFLNPLKRWNATDPEDRSGWCSQHDGLLEVSEPYVYHVRQYDTAHFEEAAVKAMDNTIEPYIPPHMTADANRKRHQVLLERGWESESVEPIRKIQEDRFLKGIY